MKNCPICQALAFDDAAVCFGCMHQFEDGADPQPAPGAASARSQPGLDAPAFLIRMTPLAEPEGTAAWSCSVEVVPA